MRFLLFDVFGEHMTKNSWAEALLRRGTKLTVVNSTNCREYLERHPPTHEAEITSGHCSTTSGATLPLPRINCNGLSVAW